MPPLARPDFGPTCELRIQHCDALNRIHVVPELASRATKLLHQEVGMPGCGHSQESTIIVRSRMATTLVTPPVSVISLGTRPSKRY